MALTGWWKADAITGIEDGGLIATWTDSSGNSRDLAQSGGDSLKPRLRKYQFNSLPCVRFDGTDDFLQSAVNLSTFFGTNGVGTILALVRFTVYTAPSASGYGIAGVNAANGTKLSLRYDHTPEAFEAQHKDAGGIDTAEVAAPEETAFRGTGPFAFGDFAPEPKIVMFRHDTAAGKLAVAVDNLDEVAQKTVDVGATNDLANALLVGRSYEHYWYGDVFEVLTYDTALSETERRAAAQILATKYALKYHSGVPVVQNASAVCRVELQLPTTELQTAARGPNKGQPFIPTLWLKADALSLNDDDPVATWPDSSGQGNDASQATAGQRPKYKTNIINGKPAVLFDGTDDNLTLTATLAKLLSADGAGTVYAIVRADSTSPTEQDQGIIRETSDAVHLQFVESGTDVLQAKNDDGSADTVTKAYTFGQFALAMWLHHPDGFSVESPYNLYVGLDALGWGDVANVASGATTSAALGNTLIIGKAGASGYLKGYIAELLVFPRAHTYAQRRHVWSYLAAKYALSGYPDPEYYPMWQNVTADVRTRDPIQFRHGIDGVEVNDRVASAGELAFTLENEGTENSGGLDGYYSPESANVRTGFRIGTPVRIVFDYLGTSYFKWYGWITDIIVEPGKNLSRAVRVRAADWIDYAARTTLSNLPVYTDDRADQLMWRLYVNSPREPLAIHFSKGSDTYPYAFDNTEDEGVLILAELHRLALSEMGFTFMRGDAWEGGRLRFEARGFRDGSPVRWSLGDPQLEALDISDHSLDGIVNRVLVEVHPRRVDAAATTVLFTLQTKPEVKRGAANAITFVAPYRDPAGGSFVRVGGINMVTPVATTDYTANTQAGGGGTDLTASFAVTYAITPGANAATVKVQNNHATLDGYLTKCQLRGKGLYAFEAVVIDVTDLTSINTYGQMTRRLDMAYQQDVNLADSIADAIIANYKDPRSKVRAVRFTAQWDTAAMMHALSREIGDRVSVTETLSGLATSEYFIHAISFEIQPGPAYRVTWRLIPVEQETYT
jgi:hypothetical protein